MLTLYVRVYGFEPGTPVEISGQATQDNGAVATFYDIQQIPNGSGQTSAAWGGPATPAGRAHRQHPRPGHRQHPQPAGSRRQPPNRA